MAIYRHVHVSFWQDAKVVEEMTPEDKYFYLYLLTNPSTTQIGIYPITKKQMAFDMGYSIESVNALLDRFENYHKLIKYNLATREIALINWGKYNFNRGGKPVEDCVTKELKEVKDKNLIALIAEKIPNERIKSLFTASLDDTSDDTSTKRGQKEKEKEKQKEKEKKDMPKKPQSPGKAKEVLSSIEDITSFVESLTASNPLPVDKDLLVKYIDCLRLTRKNARVSTSKIKTEWEKWMKYPQAVITFAMQIHIEKHDDKKEEYTLGIMRGTNEIEANRRLRQLREKTSMEESRNATGHETSKVRSGRNQEQNTESEIGQGYYDQFPGLFAN